ncbi:MAG: hypothetical protein ACUVTU_04640 [Desulfurispora sp.]|uniref:hypothetical protein n=1 Tax=Desulfurispora sp. TaxID=3014275 RepID=UPI004048FC21
MSAFTGTLPANAAAAPARPGLWRCLQKYLVKKEFTRTATIWHSAFSYDITPNTAISNFFHCPPVTRLSSGDCYLYIFSRPDYQGAYCIVRPGELVETQSCQSLIASLQPVALGSVQQSGRAPAWCWEMDGPRYLWHFGGSYRFA